MFAVMGTLMLGLPSLLTSLRPSTGDFKYESKKGESGSSLGSLFHPEDSSF